MPFLPRLKTELLETTREVFIVVIIVLYLDSTWCRNKGVQHNTSMLHPSPSLLVNVQMYVR